MKDREDPKQEQPDIEDPMQQFMELQEKQKVLQEEAKNNLERLQKLQLQMYQVKTDQRSYDPDPELLALVKAENTGRGSFDSNYSDSSINSSSPTNELLVDDHRIVQIYLRFKDKFTGVPIGEKIFLGKKFKSVFKGKDGVDWLMQREKLSKKEAKRIGNIFLKRKLIYHVSSDLLPFTDVCFYRCN